MPILYTGTNPEKYRNLGEVIHFPMIEIRPRPIPNSDVHSLLERLAQYDMILFTSRFAVRYFFELLEKNRFALTGLDGKTFVAIGEETAEALRKRGRNPDLTAQEESGEGLWKEFRQNFPEPGRKILFPRSSLPNPFLKKKLLEFGHRVEELTIYENVKPAKRPLPREKIQKIIFTSPSTARNFLDDYGAVPKDWQIFSKGPLTQRTLEELGYFSTALT